VVEEEAPGSPPRLRAFYPETAAAPKLLSAVVTYCHALTALGLPRSTAEPEIAPLLDGEWATAWQQAFPPLAVGETLLIVPPWERTAAPDRTAIVIEPARAFGTGQHGSTEGCLRLLESLAQHRWEGSGPPRRLLDIGTGTGILAIAAIKLGADRVRAIDFDPDAVAATRHNAGLNGCEARIDADLGDPAAANDETPYDLVLANLLTHTHLALARRYAGLVSEDGDLIVGGILAEEDSRVEAALASVGFEMHERLVVDGWSSLRLRRARHG
jgi:ribosomal protein L11 methyltransferase